MSYNTLTGALLVCLLLLVSFVEADEPNASSDEVIATLEYILQGHEAANQQSTTLIVSGKLFTVQKAPEGGEIPSNKVIKPGWLEFKYIQKDSKRRYEQDQRTRPGKRSYALDNNKRLLNYATNVVRIYSIAEEDENWAHLTGLYGDFPRFRNESGFANVSLAMRSLIEEIRSGKYERPDWNIAATAEDNGLFVIRAKRLMEEAEYVIDSNKGFNLVRSRYNRPSKFPRTEESEFQYKEIQPDWWVLEKAEIKGVENGVVYEKRLEINNIQAGGDVSDEIFEAESLNIPEGIYTVDYHFSPPLVLDRKVFPKAENIDKLVDSDVAKTEIATVSEKGKKIVREHEEYVEHIKNEKQEISEDSGADKPVVVGYPEHGHSANSVQHDDSTRRDLGRIAKNERFSGRVLLGISVALLAILIMFFYIRKKRKK